MGSWMKPWINSNTYIHTHTLKRNFDVCILKMCSTAMLLWFVDNKVTELALKQGVLIEEEHVECQLEMITDELLMKM